MVEVLQLGNKSDKLLKFLMLSVLKMKGFEELVRVVFDQCHDRILFSLIYYHKVVEHSLYLVSLLNREHRGKYLVRLTILLERIFVQLDLAMVRGIKL